MARFTLSNTRSIAMLESGAIDMPGTYGNWHWWQGAQFMLSDESTKELRAFESIDDCVNWLWLNGFRDAARAINGSK